MAPKSMNWSIAAKRNNYYSTLKEMAVNKSPKVLMNQRWVDTMIKTILTAREKAMHDGVASLSSTDKYALIDYDAISTSSGHRLVEKRKKPNDPDKVVVPLEDTFELIMDAHILTNHGGCAAMNKWISDSKHTVSFICAPVGISTCRQCLLETEEKTESPPEPVETYIVPSGLIDVMDMTALPDNSFKYLLIYQDVKTKFTQLRPMIGDDAVEEMTMELIKIFTDFQPVEQIFIQRNLKDLFDGVLKHLNDIFPVMTLNVYDPVNCRVVIEIESRLNSWMRRTNSTAWAVGCNFVQWEKNSFDNYQGSPFENFLGHMLSKEDSVSFESNDIETPTTSTTKPVPPRSKFKRLIRKMKSDKRKGNVNSGIPSSTSKNGNKRVIYHEIGPLIDITEDAIKDPLNIENTAPLIDKLFDSRTKPKPNINIVENEIVSVPNSVFSNVFIGDTNDISEDPLNIDLHIENPNLNTIQSIEKTLENNIHPKLKVIRNRLDYVIEDDIVGEPSNKYASSNSEFLIPEDEIECIPNPIQIKSNVSANPLSVLGNKRTITFEETFPELNLTGASKDEDEDPLKIETASSKIANAIKSLEKTFENIIKPKKVKVRNKVESVVYRETDNESATEPKRAKTTKPQRNCNKNDVNVITKQQAKSTSLVADFMKKQAAKSALIAEVINKVTGRSLNPTNVEPTETIIANETKSTKEEATPTESIVDVIDNSDKEIRIDFIAENTNQVERTTNLAEKTRNREERTTNQTEKTANHAERITIQAERTINQTESITNQAENVIIQAKCTTNSAETTTNQAENTTNQAENITNQAENITNQVEQSNEAEITDTETLTLEYITAKVVENATKLKVAETITLEPQSTNITETITEPQSTITELESHTCSTCNSVITDDLYICCVCKSSLHLYCGARTDRDGFFESICFTCIT